MTLKNSFYHICSAQTANGVALSTISLPIHNHAAELFPLTFHIAFNPSHPIFAAHFPEHPITPGVCIAQMAGELLEELAGCPLSLSYIKNLKFINPISPLTVPELIVSYQSVEPVHEGWHAKGILSRGDTTYAKFSILFTPANSPMP